MDPICMLPGIPIVNILHGSSPVADPMPTLKKAEQWAHRAANKLVLDGHLHLLQPVSAVCVQPQDCVSANHMYNEKNRLHTSVSPVIIIIILYKRSNLHVGPSQWGSGSLPSSSKLWYCCGFTESINTLMLLVRQNARGGQYRHHRGPAS